MIRYLFDPANAITMLGLLCSATGLYLLMSGQPDIATAVVLWAVLADDLDGIVAKRLQHRKPDFAAMGKSLDSFADIISGAVFPATVVIQVNAASSLSLGIAAAILAAGALRLSYFNNFGMSSDGRFMGVPLSYDVPLLAVLFLLQPLLPGEWFPMVLNLTFVSLVILHIVPIRVPAKRGIMYAANGLFIIAASSFLALPRLM